jgi:hypothetical protein
MADKKKVTELRRKSRFNALKILREHSGLPMPPRKAMSQAKKASKEMGYPVAPYPNASSLQLYRWAKTEWDKLGRWQTLAAPAAIVSALLTWEKERALQEEHQGQSDKAEARRLAARALYRIEQPKRKRKLLGFIPLPGR